MKKICLIAVALLALAACSRQPQGAVVAVTEEGLTGSLAGCVADAGATF